MRRHHFSTQRARLGHFRYGFGIRADGSGGPKGPELECLDACLVAYERACPMMHRMYAAAFIASLGVALTLAPDQSFGKSGAASGGKSASAHSASHSSAMRPSGHANLSSLRDRRQRNAGWALWPTTGGVYGIDQSLQPSTVEPNMDATRSISQHVTYTYDVPWDAVHRYPKVYEYAAGCRSQTETVPRGGGKKQSVNIVRCY